MSEFLVSLPAELEGTDFTVIAPDGGYGPALEAAVEQLLPAIDLLITRDRQRILLRVHLSEEFSLQKARFAWPTAVAEILDEDAFPTGNFVEVNLMLLIIDASDGDPVGRATMRSIEVIPFPTTIPKMIA